jgi:serine/threonine protein kinase
VSSHAQDLVSPGVGGVAAFAPPEEFDDFVVLRRLGQGATGQVYLAEDSVLARPVAIKFIGADPDPAARQRFLMEARAAA